MKSRAAILTRCGSGSFDLASQPDAEAMRQLLSNPDAWADAAKNSRHLVAHGGKSSTDVNLLYAITKVTTAVVVMNLLHQLRIPRERLMYVTDNNRALREAASLSRRYWPSVGPEAEGGDGDDAGQSSDDRRTRPMVKTGARAEALRRLLIAAGFHSDRERPDPPTLDTRLASELMSYVREGDTVVVW